MPLIQIFKDGPERVGKVGKFFITDQARIDEFLRIEERMPVKRIVLVSGGGKILKRL